MSELKNAIDYFDGKKRRTPPEGHFPVVLEAARNWDAAQDGLDLLKETGVEVQVSVVTDKDKYVWKCISHNCDVTPLPFNKPFDPAEEFCSIEGEWGSLSPENCEIVRGVFVRENRHVVTP